MTRNGLLRGVFALAYLVSLAQATSCVQISNVDFAEECGCHSSTSFTFDVEGKVGLEENTVSLAIVVDGSSGPSPAEFDLQKSFARDAAASFAEKNLFENGGTASYVQADDTVVSDGAFTSLEAFDAFVAGDAFSEGSAFNAKEGISKAQELLRASPSAAAAAFMLVVTDEDCDPGSEAEAARADGTTIFAVGVGNGVSNATLVAIAGDATNVFHVADFDALDGALDDILDSAAAAAPCPSTGVVIDIEFNARVVPTLSQPGTDESAISLSVDDLESNPTTFELLLDTCDFTDGEAVVASATYTDDQGNAPDMSVMEEIGVVPECAYARVGTSRLPSCSCPSATACGCGGGPSWDPSPPAPSPWVNEVREKRRPPYWRPPGLVPASTDDTSSWSA
eukprot:g12670.t1